MSISIYIVSGPPPFSSLLWSEIVCKVNTDVYQYIHSFRAIPPFFLSLLWSDIVGKKVKTFN
jgi:hypothetical protein